MFILSPISLRYDTFCLFHSEDDDIMFFDYLNSRYPNIRFTMEKKFNHKWTFLDVLIDNNNLYFSLTRVHRKKTFRFDMIAKLYILYYWLVLA